MQKFIEREHGPMGHGILSAAVVIGEYEEIWVYIQLNISFRQKVAYVIELYTSPASFSNLKNGRNQ